MKNMLYGLMSRWTTVLAILFVMACGLTPQETARVSLGVAASGVRAVDIVSAQAYTDRARAALDASADLAAYRATMGPLDTLEASLRSADEILLATEAAVDAWDHGGSAQWLALAACVAGALEHIRMAITAAGVQLPSELVQALDTATTFTGTCPSPTPVPATAGGAS